MAVARSPGAERFGPFRPGYGQVPPHLAGRAREQAHFRGLLGLLAEGAPPPSNVVLYGPRGNGKTVLLGWLEDEAASFPGVEVVLKTPSVLRDRTRLAEALLPESWWKRFAPSEVSVAGVSWRPGDDRPPAAEAILTARAGRAPLVLLLDEAHTLDPEVGQELLNAAQVVGRRLPLLLVLAGTPNLPSHLATMGASFWNRADQIRVGRLSEAAAAEAFRVPLEGGGIGLSANVLKAMAEESQGYPWFVQLLGRAVWRQAVAASEGEREVRAETLAEARPEFEGAKGEYYALRLEELRKRRLLRVGRAVANGFARRPVLSVAQLESAIGDGLGTTADPERVEEAMDALGDLGFVWRVQARMEWEPGIPSLMDYTREHA